MDALALRSKEAPAGEGLRLWREVGRLARGILLPLFGVEAEDDVDFAGVVCPGAGTPTTPRPLIPDARDDCDCD